MGEVRNRTDSRWSGKWWGDKHFGPDDGLPASLIPFPQKSCESGSHISDSNLKSKCMHVFMNLIYMQSLFMIHERVTGAQREALWYTSNCFDLSTLFPYPNPSSRQQVHTQCLMDTRMTHYSNDCTWQCVRIERFTDQFVSYPNHWPLVSLVRSSLLVTL